MKPGPPPVAALAAATLGAVAALPSLPNGFVYDDVLVILQNPLVHGLSRSAELWHSSYWPAGLLYRPLTVQLFAIQWTIGGGHPLVFHAVSALLAAVIALLLFRLAFRIFPTEPNNPRNLRNLWLPWFLTAVFVLHPVHVEAVANVVGQAELLAALFALLTVERYLAWRRDGGLTPGRRLLLAGLTLLGILSKETGYAIPFLLLAAELTVVRRPRVRLGDTYLLQGLVVAVALLLRATLLGSLAGEHPTVVFRGLGLLDRAIAMLAVIPEWARLLLWPAHLQAEYGPPELPLTPAFGAAHLLGLLLLLLCIVLLWRSWKRNPALALATLWVLLALAPVSNVVAPGGLLLGERVLFLPSVGVVLLLGAAVTALLPRLRVAPGPLRLAAAAAALLLLALAAARSAARATVWRSQEGFFAALERDAPRTYRAHFVASRFYYGERRHAEAEAAARRALALYPLDPQVHEQLGQVLRVAGRCGEALPILAGGLELEPGRTTLRSRLIECALALGDTARARRVAEDAVRLGQTEFNSTLKRLSPDH